MGNITVGIPYYFNTKVEELIDAVDSIINQSILVEVVVLIQDGPVSCELKEAVDRYMLKYPFIKSLVIEERNGLPYALNLSILKCRTEFYARMDSDDISHPNRLERQLEYLQNNPDIDIVGTWAIEYEKNINDPANLVRKVPAGIEEIRSLFHYRNPMNHATILFRRNVFAKIGLYNPAFLKAQDTELYARAIKANVGMANIPEVLYYIRVTDVLNRRTTLEHIKYQTLGRYKYNTWSIKLNILKVLSILFRFFPKEIQKKCYNLYRW